MIALLLTLLVQTPPSGWTQAQYDLCLEIEQNLGIPLADCPCSPFAGEWEGSFAPEPDGACCTIFGCITVECEEQCLEIGGAWQGYLDCLPNSCDILAFCCFGETCLEVMPSVCLSLNGSVDGCSDTSSCMPSLAVHAGACCLPNDSWRDCHNFDEDSIVGAEAICLGLNGIWYGGLYCVAVNCDEYEDCEFLTGACCDETSGDCSVITEASCLANFPASTYMGDDSECKDCEGDGTGGDGVTRGACCVGQICNYVSVQTCNTQGGIYQGDNQPCNSTICADYGGGWEPPDPDPDETTLGACCLADGTCLPNMLFVDCQAQNGNWISGASCLDTPCDNYHKNLCECILLDAILTTNNRILSELLDQGVSLDTAVAILDSIERTLREDTNAYLASMTQLLDYLVLEQMEDVLSYLENINITLMDIADGLDPTGVDNDVSGQLTYDPESVLENLLGNAQETAPTITGVFPNPVENIGVPILVIPASTFQFSLNGHQFLLTNDFEFDTAILDQWGLLTIFKGIIMLLASIYCANMLWEELRKY
jgi:hypothetical protein